MTDLLAVDHLSAGYGEARVITGLDLRLGEGRSLAVLGRNGAGKTTLINSLIGVTTRHAGRIAFAGVDVTALSPYQRARAGLGWVPQERNIFRSLSVEENLTAVALPGPWTLKRVYSMFPRLKERRRNGGGQLSGGEQQMLAIGRALMTNPRLLILDEATEGLAPLVRAEIWHALAALKAAQQSILVIDKNVAALTRIADRHYVLERGQIVWRGSSAELAADVELQHRYLGV
ncbi:MAG TPA: ABC transporter ATP-binding protein [Roseiarcus sp.]|nr:ABC transporter ATP-binding protein [Roseiarcus sp.]